MNTLSNEISIAQVAATGLRFEGANTLCSTTLYIALSDGREVSLLLDQIAWLSWLAEGPTPCGCEHTVFDTHWVRSVQPNVKTDRLSRVGMRSMAYPTPEGSRVRRKP